MIGRGTARRAPTTQARPPHRHPKSEKVTAAVMPQQTFQAGGGEWGAQTVAPTQDVHTPRRGTARRAPTCSYPTSRLCTQVATATSPIDTSTRIADSAFTSGVTADLSIPYTLIGSVVEPTPAVKKLMMKSSNESVNAISSAPMMPGISSGNVTRLKATQGVAPRSSAASSSRGSSLRMFVRNIKATTEKLNI